MEKIFLSIKNPAQCREEIESNYKHTGIISKPSKSAVPEAQTEYYNAKVAQEMDWMNGLVKGTCDEIKKVLENEKPKEDKLYVFLLPELWMHARNDGRTAEEGERGAGLTDYKRPFLPEVVKAILEENSEYCKLTNQYPNLLLCPGTVWWKEKVLDAPETVQETYFQSAPVFWNGKCIFFWDKQLLSGKDGAGEYNDENKDKWKKWMDYRKSVINKAEKQTEIDTEAIPEDQKVIHGILEYLRERKEPIRSTLGQNYSGNNKTNCFSLEWQGEKLFFSIEICLDCEYEITKILTEEEPDIQLVLSNSLGFRWDLTYMKERAFWCDLEYGNFEFRKDTNEVIELGKVEE